jgi:DNA-binding LacI/PurR family transcriptional regulator
MSALNANGITISEKNIFTVSTTTRDVEDEFKEYVRSRSGKLPTALFCESDYIAIGVIKALQALGISVPGEISVIGFDNVPESTIISPELTTIHVEKEEMGALAVEKLHKILSSNEESQIANKIIIDTRLVERKSCKQR